MSPATVNVTDEKFVVDPDLRSHSEERPDPQTTPGPKGEVVRARARRAASCGRGGVDRHPAHENFQPPKHNDDDRRDGGREYVLLREIAHAKPVLAVAPRSSSITCDRGEKNVNVNGTTQEERWAWSDGGWRSTDRGTLMRRACGLIVVNSTKRRARLIWPLRANALVSRHRYL